MDFEHHPVFRTDHRKLKALLSSGWKGGMGASCLVATYIIDTVTLQGVQMWTLALLIQRNRLGASPLLRLREEIDPISGTLFLGGTETNNQIIFSFCVFT